MNEPVVPEAPVAGESEALALGQPSVEHAGQMLRQAREAVGLHVAALAVSLKVPVGKLEALEAGRLDALPDVMFARALAASVCRTLKVDPAPVLAHFPQGAASRLGVVESTINTPFKPPHAGPRFGLKGQMPSPSVISVVVLLVAALAVFLWPRSKEAVQDVSQSLEVPTVAAVSAPESVAEPLTDVSAPMPAQVQAATAAISAPAAVTAAVSSPVDVASASGILVLTATAESWVKVTDAKGAVVLSRIMNAGEVVQPPGTPPFEMVVGRVDAVQLQVRGLAFDMTPFAKDRVARFEVK